MCPMTSERHCQSAAVKPTKPPTSIPAARRCCLKQILSMASAEPSTRNRRTGFPPPPANLGSSRPRRTARAGSERPRRSAPAGHSRGSLCGFGRASARPRGHRAPPAVRHPASARHILAVEPPRAQPVDADPGHLVAVRVQCSQYASGRNARDAVLRTRTPVDDPTRIRDSDTVLTIVEES